MNTCFLSIVIPAYNEERRLPPTLFKVISYLQRQPYTSEILVVTDGSRDATVEVGSLFQHIFPSLRVISFPENKGKGFSTKQGMLKATGQTRLFMDADYAVPIEFIEPCLQKLSEGYDIAIGSRSAPGAKIIKNQAFPRHELAVLFGYLQRAVLSLPIIDTQCGFKLFTAEAAQKYFSLMTLDCAFFDTEVLYLAHNMYARIAEVPVDWTHDNETRLPIGVRRSLELIANLYKIRKKHAVTLAGIYNNKTGEVCKNNPA